MSKLGSTLVDIEKSEISSNLNSSILLVFGMGMYTVIYFGTMYFYFARSFSKHRIVPTIITTLFLCNVVETGLQWYITKWQFVDNGDTQDSVYMALFDNPPWAYLAFDIPYYMGYVLGDGLLIWRCFFVWNRSFRVISVPLFLIITETALFFAQIVFQAIYGNLPPVALAIMMNDLSFAAFFASFSTSLVTTVLIAYRIYSVSKQEGVSARRFKHIIDIVVQSGAVYSLSLLVSAIAVVLPQESNFSSTWRVAFACYTTMLVNVIAGISATILVARVSMLATDTTFPSTSIHLSGLQFHAHSTRQTAPPEATENTHSVDINRNPVEERHEVEGKIQ